MERVSWILFFLACSLLNSEFSYASSRLFPSKAERGLLTSQGFNVQLMHRDHIRSPLRNTHEQTESQRLAESFARGKVRGRALALQSKKKGAPDLSWYFPVGNVDPISAVLGEYLMSITLGTPARTFTTIMDTGSDLVWIQCKPCDQLATNETACFKQPDPLFNIFKSSTFKRTKCYSEQCEELETNCPGSTHCGRSSGQVCEYQYRYGDLSITQGDFSTETFLFNSTFGVQSLTDVKFGCGTKNGMDNNPGVDGIVGMGRAPFSYTSQLGKLFGEGFSYCLLPPAGSRQSTSNMIIGSGALQPSDKEIRYTPLMNNKNNHYYVSLQGISVAGQRLDINSSLFEIHDDDGGGVVIDSGTTITLMFDEALNKTRDALIPRIGYPRVPYSIGIGITKVELLCYNVPGESHPEFPLITFHFEGADWDLPTENTFVRASNLGNIKANSIDVESTVSHGKVKNLMCLSWVGSGDDLYAIGIIGNIAQRDFLIIHDTANNRLGFKKTDCSKT